MFHRFIDCAAPMAGQHLTKIARRVRRETAKPLIQRALSMLFHRFTRCARRDPAAP